MLNLVVSEVIARLMVSLSTCNDGDSPHVIGLLTPAQLLACRRARTLHLVTSSLYVFFYASAAV